MELAVFSWSDIFSLAFLSSLLMIVFIDLVLAGDNAVVIALAARRLPKEQQKKVILLGTGGAIIIRILATLVVVQLLEISFLKLVGGLLLLWIAYKLLVAEEEHHIEAKNSIWAAVGTIVIADASMGIDNVIAVAGAADHNMLLVVLGLLISIPVIVWGSTLFIKWIERWPWIVYLGAGVLAFTAAKMITGEKAYYDFFHDNPVLKWALTVVIILLVITAGKLTNDWKAKKSIEKQSNQEKPAVDA